ncbi:hypothetical protein [Lacisediminihabitans changchengi]|uniref:Uncharacterized protein n=1 Tax=Lacisediminihabitans changchengi TaxID=2787634 RepID=A0A934W5M8_9MICO|nr:hypothetical protein [Lacisediminihabitans changchengi]MBK4348690.1 hypothetical protein [Lacisediminihabitans changchengi]
MTGFTNANANARWDNWDAVLSAMEQYVERAVAKDANGSDDAGEPEIGERVWSLPSDIGPMPAELRERAARVLDAQNDGVAELERRQRSIGKHLAALRTVPTGQVGGGSPYLDVTG